MNILVVGSGAREHAIITALNRSPKQPQIFCCGTAVNPGVKAQTQGYWVGDIRNCSDILQMAYEWKIQLVIIGPEAPLEQGLADQLWAASIPVIGPKKNLAKIETSKSFARQLMHKYEIPGLPAYRVFSDMNGISEFLNELGEGNYVIKANGLMGGKGVKVAGDHLHSFREAMHYCKEIFNLGQTLVIEEKLIGQEFSLMCFCDGQRIVPMPLVQDHKRAFINDKGPNTGGMGSYSDADHSLPFLQKEDIEQALKINQGVLRALMQQENDKYIGILYGGFIATAKGVYVIEFNARFGDPEALNVLTLLKTDFVELCQCLVTNDLSSISVDFAAKATVCKYVVPLGYPDNPVKNTSLDISKVKNKSCLYLASVDVKNNQLIAAGSRTAAFVGVADSIAEAEQLAEKEINAISGELYHREDIGTAKLINERVQFMHELRSL